MNRARLLIPLILMPCIGCHKTPFEQQQFNAEAANPHWLSIELDTSNGRHTYKESEPVTFEVSYSSAVRGYYKAEIAEGESTVAASDTIHVSDGRDMQLNVFGIVCCGSRLIGLNDEPYVYRPKLLLYFKPGTYEMYVTTHRVFPWDITPSVYSNSEWKTSSNMLELHVLPDPGWQERLLAEIGKKPTSAGSCVSLSLLDIPAATEVKLDKIRNNIPCEPGTSFHFFNESEYSIAIKGMEEIIRSPSHGVVQEDVQQILSMRSWMLHPDLRKFPEEEARFGEYRERLARIHIEEEKALVRELCSILPVKLPGARATTEQTIDQLTENKVARIPPCQ